MLAACLGGFALLATGVPRLHYASDFGFGEQSFVVRSLRAIEANFRKPMTTEVVVTLPRGAHVYDAASLGAAGSHRGAVRREATTGDTWSFLDLLEDAHRIDRGRSPASFDELVADAARTVALVASTENARWFWRKRSAMASASARASRSIAPGSMTRRRPRTSRASATR